MNKYQFKAWAKSKKKSYWWFVGGITAFVIIALVCGVIGMYASGYTLISWFSKFYAPFVIIGAVVILVVIYILLRKLRKK